MVETTRPQDRLPFAPIHQRPPLTLPDGLRLIVWLIVNVEDWDIRYPMARQVLTAPTEQRYQPDLPNWAWHEYGMRVGFWRLHEKLTQLAITPTLSINAKVCETYVPVAEAAKESGWEFMAHSYIQRPLHTEEDQAGTVFKAVEAIERFTGERPLGWLGPGLTETSNTPELLVQAGLKYVADWVLDEEPVTLNTQSGPLVSIPYTVELNDIPVCMIQHHESSEFTARIQDHFDTLYSEAQHRAKFMAIAIHPYITGVPHRFKRFVDILSHLNAQAGVAFWTGADIYRWYVSRNKE